MPKIRSLLLVLTLGMFVAACGGSDGPTDPGNSDDDGGGTGGETRSVKTDPSFASDVMEIFNRRGCTASSCHGSSSQGDLTLTPTSTAYANLVGVQSTGTGEVLVIAGNADGSYLVKKLEGSATAGVQMPSGGAPLDNIDLSNIKNWINQGAKNN